MPERRSVPIPIGDGDANIRIFSKLVEEGFIFNGEWRLDAGDRVGPHVVIWVDSIKPIMYSNEYDLYLDSIFYDPDENPYYCSDVTAIYNIAGRSQPLASIVIANSPDVLDKIIAFVRGNDTFKDDFIPIDKDN